MGCKTIGRFVFDSPTTAVVNANGNIPVPNSTITNDCIECDGTNITINRCGLYLVLVNLTHVATAADPVETQLFRNGMAIPGAHAIDTAAAAGDNVSQAYDALITVPRCGSVVINVRAITATSIRIANVLVVKVA